MEHKDRNIFQIKPFVILFALTAVLAWAFAFPMIKLGFSEFDIGDNDTGAKTLFAGVRFFMAGIFTLIVFLFRKGDKKTTDKSKKGIFLLLVFSVVNTTLHYFFFYMGLSNLPGSRSAIIDSLGTFLLIIFACIIFKNEHMTFRKVLGCILGFAGILAVNLNKDGLDFGSLSIAGDGMLFMSALCSAFGGILTRLVTQRYDALFATGVSLAAGGFFLIIAGIMSGGELKAVTAEGISILIFLVLISAVGFSLYNRLISCNPVGKIAIFNSFIPVFGAVLSCLLLGETFYIKYIPAAILVFAGVYTINSQED